MSVLKKKVLTCAKVFQPNIYSDTSLYIKGINKRFKIALQIAQMQALTRWLFFSLKMGLRWEMQSRPMSLVRELII